MLTVFIFLGKPSCGANTYLIQPWKMQHACINCLVIWLGILRKLVAQLPPQNPPLPRTNSRTGSYRQLQAATGIPGIPGTVATYRWSSSKDPRNTGMTNNSS